MDMIQRNPRDPKYREFHDGEYEYWPIAKSSHKSRKVSFPSALASGLELVAAALAAGLLALILSQLYVYCAPQTIYSHSAVINVKIFNNHDGTPVSYTLSREADPDRTLQEGQLTDHKEVLSLKGLSGGTEYLLEFFSPGEEGDELVGTFRFTTTGTPSDPEGTPGGGTVQPEGTEPGGTEPPDASEPSESSEPTETEPEETEPEETEPTRPGNPFWEPATPAAPTEAPTTPPTEAPTEPPTEAPTTPPPYSGEPEVDDVVFESTDSSNPIDGYYKWREIHKFYDVPDIAYGVTIDQDGTVITSYDVSYALDGALLIYVHTEPVAIGDTAHTTVTITCEDGTTVTSTNTLKPPELVGMNVEVTKNPDGSCTFTVTASSDSGNPLGLNCNAMLYVIWRSDVYEDWFTESFALTYSSGSCSGSVTKSLLNSDGAVLNPDYIYIQATVSGIWDEAGAPGEVERPQTLSDTYTFTYVIGEL